MRKISRREFILRSAGAAVGMELSRRLVLPAGAPAALASALPNVAVSQGTNADSATTILKTALEGLGGISRFVKPGQTVAIKPNATWAYKPGTASSTDPDMLRALILMVREAGAKRIIVMDHCSIDPGTAECLQETGIGAVLDALDVEKVFPDRYNAPRDVYALVKLPQGKAFNELGVIKAAVEADVRINMAVAKSHLVTKFTLCLKHMMGFMQIPGALHAQLEQGIADLNTVSPIQAHLHILEAIRVRYPVGGFRQAGGDETELTNPKRVKRLNEIVVGVDPVLIDAYALLTYYASKPQELAHVKLAHDLNLGDIDVEQAKADGRLAFFVAGKPTATPPATATATGTPTPPTTATIPPTETATATSTPAGPPPTSTPLPTASAAPIEPLPTAPVAASQAAAIISPNRILNGALIPAAAVLAGASVVVRGRLDKKGTAKAPNPCDEERAGGQ